MPSVLAARMEFPGKSDNTKGAYLNKLLKYWGWQIKKGKDWVVTEKAPQGSYKTNIPFENVACSHTGYHVHWCEEITRLISRKIANHK